MTNKHKGSTFDDFLIEEGIFDDAEVIAVKRVVAYELEQAMLKKHLNKINLAKKMHTSRSALDRLLDPENTSITLNSLVKVAHVLGKRVNVSFAS